MTRPGPYGVGLGEGNDVTKLIPLCVLLAALCGCLVFSTGARELETFSYQGIDQVEVKGEFLAVEVSAGSDAGVAMTSELPDESVYGPRRFAVKHEVVGSRLVVWVEKDPGVWNVLGGGRLLFVVPAGTALSVDTVSGSILVNGLETASLRVASVSGSAEVSRSRAPLVVTNVSGAVSIDDFQGALSAQTVSGAIYCRAMRLDGDSSFITTSGAISVSFSSPLEDYRFELSSVSGNLTVGSIRAARGLRVGSGAVRVHGETVSGAQSYK